MKKLVQLFILSSLAVHLLTFNLWAQEEKKAEKPTKQLFSIHTDFVKPSMIGQYEMAIKEFKAKLTEHNVNTISYFSAVTDDNQYFHVSPIKNMAELDADPLKEMSKAMGEEAMAAMWKNFDNCYDVHKNFLATLQYELSYSPESVMKMAKDNTFRHWDFYYVIPGKDDEARAISKEWKALYAKNNIDRGYYLYTGGMGMEMPVYVVLQVAKDLADFAAYQNKVNETLGEAAQKLMQKTMAITRKLESKNGWARPDLSYLPEMKDTASK